MVAQAIDLPTSVRLARTKDVDIRLFRRAPTPPATDVCMFFMQDFNSNMMSHDRVYFAVTAIERVLMNEEQC